MLLLLMLLSFPTFQTIDGVDVYTIEARQPIAGCLSACVWCGPPAPVICESSTPMGDACVSPVWTQCEGTGQTVQLAMSYYDPDGAVWVDFEDFAMDRGRPLQALLARSLIFTDGFETGDLAAWTTSTSD